MNSLNELIGQEVTACFDVKGNGENECIRAKVQSIEIDDWYFEEKAFEPIYIKVAVQPLEALPDGVDVEMLSEVPLENILR